MVSIEGRAKAIRGGRATRRKREARDKTRRREREGMEGGKDEKGGGNGDHRGRSNPLQGISLSLCLSILPSPLIYCLTRNPHAP